MIGLVARAMNYTVMMMKLESSLLTTEIVDLVIDAYSKFLFGNTVYK